MTRGAGGVADEREQTGGSVGQRGARAQQQQQSRLSVRPLAAQPAAAAECCGGGSGGGGEQAHRVEQEGEDGHGAGVGAGL